MHAFYILFSSRRGISWNTVVVHFLPFSFLSNFGVQWLSPSSLDILYRFSLSNLWIFSEALTFEVIESPVSTFAGFPLCAFEQRTCRQSLLWEPLLALQHTCHLVFMQSVTLSWLHRQRTYLGIPFKVQWPPSSPQAWRQEVCDTLRSTPGPRCRQRQPGTCTVQITGD